MKKKIIVLLSVVVILFYAAWKWDEVEDLIFEYITLPQMTSTASENVEYLVEAADIYTLDRTRTLRVYTPPGYQSSQDRHPVIYMTDAGMLFDNKTTWKRGEEYLDEFLDEQISNGGRGVIVVGIDSESGKRHRELNPFHLENQAHNEADLFLKYIVEGLKPMIDTKYRTLKQRENTAIMGASLGGHFACYAIMKYPEVFSKAGCFSTSFLEESNIEDMPSKLDGQDIQIYMNAGSNEWHKIIGSMQQLDVSMKENGFAEDQFRSSLVNNGGHEPKVWSIGFQYAYKWFFNEEK